MARRTGRVCHHEYVSLLGLAFAAYHGLVLIGDHFVDFSLPRLLIPFSIAYEPVWVGLGQVGFYIWVFVTASFYVRRFIGQKTWRLIHYVNFATYTMGLLHGIFSGTDSDANWVRWYYLACGGILLALLAYRVYDSAWRKNLSLPYSLQQSVQDLTQVSTSFKIIFIALKKKLAALFRRQRSLPASPMDKPGTPAIAPSIPDQTMSESSPQASTDEETQTQDSSEIPAIEDQSQIPENSPFADSAAPVSDIRETLPAPMIKLEKTPSEDRVKVQVFKESTTRPVILETQKDAEIKQVDAETLLVRLKKDSHRALVQPAAPHRRSKRIVILEE